MIKKTASRKAGKYKRMLAGLKDGGPAEWSVYIAVCRDGSFYTGIAKNVEARAAAHNAGRGAAYTRSRRPVVVGYQEHGMTRSGALIREAAIKALPRPKKSELIAKSS